MKKQFVETSEAPAPIGPYSQGVGAGGFLFLSGQIPIDPATGEMTGDDIAAQTEQVLTNLVAVLSQAGASADDVVKTTVYLDDANIGRFCTLLEQVKRVAATMDLQILISTHEKSVLPFLDTVIDVGEEQVTIAV